jgi:Antitoxin Xre/MbcA/ParS C-terminal toxin-binding domain
MHRHDRNCVLDLVERLFGDHDKAVQWLDRPSVPPGGRSPRKSSRETTGVRRVEELLPQTDDDGLSPAFNPTIPATAGNSLTKRGILS